MHMPDFDRRLWLVIVAGLVVFTATTWRMLRVEPVRAKGEQQLQCFATNFETLDHRSSSEQFRLVKLKAYLGRTKIALIFYDGPNGAEKDPWLVQLRDAHDAVDSAEIQVLGVSTASPYANREAEKRAGRKFPFPLLSDLAAEEQPPPIHMQWGLAEAALALARSRQVLPGAAAAAPATQVPDPSNRRPLPRLPALFLIDRGGRVACRDGVPVQSANPAAAIEAICRGEWPE